MVKQKAQLTSVETIWLDDSIFNVAPREFFLTKKDGVLEAMRLPLASLEMPAHGG